MGRVIDISRKQVFVTVDDRKFVVQINAEGKPVRIYERKGFIIAGTGGKSSGVYNQSYWSHTQHRMPKRGICFRIMEAAGCVPTEP